MHSDKNLILAHKSKNREVRKASEENAKKALYSLNLLLFELRHRGLAYATQVSVTVHYKGEKIHGQILDMVVEGKVILELKSVEMLMPIHEAQILSYLKSTGLPAGLLINFKERLVKDGIKRFVQSKHYN